MPKVSRIEVVSTGARRRWTLAEKRRIVAESNGGRGEVSDEAAALVPVEIVTPAASGSATAEERDRDDRGPLAKGAKSAGSILIEFGPGCRIRVDGDFDAFRAGCMSGSQLATRICARGLMASPSWCRRRLGGKVPSAWRPDAQPLDLRRGRQQGAGALLRRLRSGTCHSGAANARAVDREGRALAFAEGMRHTCRAQARSRRPALAPPLARPPPHRTPAMKSRRLTGSPRRPWPTTFPGW
jgi:transposase